MEEGSQVSPLKYTELSKKEQGAIRYAKQQARHKAKQAKKTRPSDTRSKAGPVAKIKPQTEFQSRWPVVKKRSKTNPYASLLEQLDAVLPSKK